MAIRFKDKGGGREKSKGEPPAEKDVAEERTTAPGEGASELPFGKPVKTEKKGKKPVR